MRPGCRPVREPVTTTWPSCVVPRKLICVSGDAVVVPGRGYTETFAAASARAMTISSTRPLKPSRRRCAPVSLAKESIAPEATGQGIRFEIRSWRAAVGTRDTAKPLGTCAWEGGRADRVRARRPVDSVTDHRGLATGPLGTTGVSMARTAVLGLPRMGAEPRAEVRAGVLLGRAHRLRGARSDRPRAARRQLAARAGRRDRRDPVRRLLALRPRARHGVGAGRGRPRRGLLRARPRHRRRASRSS